MDASLQQWNSERYARTGRFVSDLGVDALALLAPQPEEYVLDLGVVMARSPKSWHRQDVVSWLLTVALTKFELRKRVD